MTALTSREEDAFKNQNGVAAVQASREDPGGEGSDTFLHPWELGFWDAALRLRDTTSHSQNSIRQQLPPATLGLKPPPVTMQPFQTPTNPA